MPTGTPTTTEDVKTYLGIADNKDDVDLDVIVLAVDELVRGLPVADGLDEDDDWPKRISLGALLLSSRLLARKNSPEGVAAFSSEGPIYVQRNDPDVAMMLRLGAWSKPAAS